LYLGVAVLPVDTRAFWREASSMKKNYWGTEWLGGFRERRHWSRLLLKGSGGQAR
jgi:hypothetical protein